MLGSGAKVRTKGKSSTSTNDAKNTQTNSPRAALSGAKRQLRLNSKEHCQSRNDECEHEPKNVTT